MKHTENYYNPILEDRMARVFGILYTIVLILFIIKALIWIMQ